MIYAFVAAKYPKPWTFEQSDLDGGGRLFDGNGQLLMILSGDYDWEEHGPDPDKPDPKYEPAIQQETIGPMLIEYLLDCVNTKGSRK